MASSRENLLLLFTLLHALCLAAAIPQVVDFLILRQKLLGTDRHGKTTLNPTLQSRYGWLRGLRLTVKGTNCAVNAYLGIPFAKPPVGARRFSPPEPAEEWNNMRDATSNPPMCLQTNETAKVIGGLFNMEVPAMPMSEDCLYLNVYTPADASKNSKLPVMVWIHGGGFTIGSASTLDGSALSAHENLVVVCIQYRLGIMGFLSTGDKFARGNWGFLDQVAALNWVKESINEFGGDPGSVTIFGESAGGISTSAHILSPLSKGLFHKAISESGVLVSSGVITDDLEIVRGVAEMVANRSGCETSDSAAILACLRKKPEAHFLKPEIMELGFVPGVVDGYFLLKSPEQLLAEKPINSIPHLIGCNNQEFGWILPNLFQIPDLRNGMDEKQEELSMRIVGGVLGIEPEFFHLLIKEYLQDAKNAMQRRDNFLEMAGDGMFVTEAVLRARYHRDAGLPVFVYEFQHSPSILKSSRPPYVMVDHTDEIYFVSGSAFLGSDLSPFGNFTEEEKSFTKKVMKYFANFARSGNPSGPGLPKWPLYDLSEKYLQLNLQPKAATKWKDKRVTFWSKTLPKQIEGAKKQRQAV